MPRLLHLIAELEPGGAATQLVLMAQAAAARGDEVHVATLRRPGPGGDRLRRAGVPVAWIGCRFRVDPFALARLTRLVRRERPDALQTWDNASASLGRIVGRWAGLPWLHVHRGGDAPRLDGAAAVITPNDAGAAPGVVVAPNAYSPSIQPAGAEERLAARRRLREAGYDVADDAPVIACVARIDDATATKEIAWAADLVRVVTPGLRLLVAGDGRARLACQRFAARACEPGTVVWLGAVDDPAVVYAAANVAWVGRGAGATPTPAVEAMAAGLPVVAADAPGRERLLPHDTSSGRPCWRVRWDDRAAWARATKRLLTEPELAEDVGAENARRVRPTHAVGQVVESYAVAVRAALA